MSPRGTRQKPIIYKVLGKIRNISPDDIKARLLLRDQQQAMDTRDAAARWLGDPPPHQSALTRRATVPEKPR
jgi:hypothetical protein